MHLFLIINNILAFYWMVQDMHSITVLINNFFIYIYIFVTLAVLEVYQRVALLKWQSNGGLAFNFGQRIYSILHPLYNTSAGRVFSTLPHLLQPSLHHHSSSFFSSWPPTTPR